MPLAAPPRLRGPPGNRPSPRRRKRLPPGLRPGRSYLAPPACRQHLAPACAAQGAPVSEPLPPSRPQAFSLSPTTCQLSVVIFHAPHDRRCLLSRQPFALDRDAVAAYREGGETRKPRTGGNPPGRGLIAYFSSDCWPSTSVALKALALGTRTLQSGLPADS